MNQDATACKVTRLGRRYMNPADQSPERLMLSGLCSRVPIETRCSTIPIDVFLYTECSCLVIRTFRDERTEALFSDEDVARFRQIERIARRKLALLHRARSVPDLRVPPGNRLERLQGDRAGRYGIRINDQWRVCFGWKDGDAHDVEIVDYH